MSEESGGIAYRLEDDSFRLVFIGRPEDEISDFCETLNNHWSHALDNDLSLQMTKKIGFVLSASGATNDLSKLIAEVDFPNCSLE